MEANDPRKKSWIDIESSSDFSIQNLPFGIFSNNGNPKRVGVAIGDYVLDLAALYDLGFLDLGKYARSHFESEYLNCMMKIGKQGTTELRNRISHLLSTDCDDLKLSTKKDVFLHKQESVTMHLPVEIGDYTDFYSSQDHARNVGTMFRDPDNALLPNWKHIPVGYHGRSSSIVLSGEPIHRPKGQMKPKDQTEPSFGPCKLLDFELEMAFVTFNGKPMGQSISTGEAEDYIFGMVIFNDWSARDIQTWEYVPLGPFLAKNFASSISPWIVTMDALEPFKVAGSNQEPKVFPYLEFDGNKNIDINLEVLIEPEGQEATCVSNSNYKYMYWNYAQQLAHHTINGCPTRVGDMMASGTISGPVPTSYGSMLEISWRGTKPVSMNDGSERKFIQDHDSVIMRAYSEKNGVRVGFGEVNSKVLPAS
ncbi:MAG TPA: fumarylacetoacetase [Flavobacteriales bacterium]|nr:fumarylacetoacetase [Flavobacteriales bacterium]